MPGTSTGTGTGTGTTGTTFSPASSTSTGTGQRPTVAPVLAPPALLSRFSPAPPAAPVPAPAKDPQSGWRVLVRSSSLRAAHTTHVHSATPSASLQGKAHEASTGHKAKRLHCYIFVRVPRRELRRGRRVPVAVGRGVAAGPLGLATLVTARAGPSRAVTVIHDSCTQ